jgi:hypothetical protein
MSKAISSHCAETPAVAAFPASVSRKPLQGWVGRHHGRTNFTPTTLTTYTSAGESSRPAPEIVDLDTAGAISPSHAAGQRQEIGSEFESHDANSRPKGYAQIGHERNGVFLTCHGPSAHTAPTAGGPPYDVCGGWSCHVAAPSWTRRHRRADHVAAELRAGRMPSPHA